MGSFSVPPLSLYVHIPWCVRKCPYCDFNSHALKADLDQAAYVTALLADLERDAEQVESRSVQSIFIGGGTPSLFSGESIHRLLDGVRQYLNLSNEAEITLEANPGAIDAGHFSVYRQAGVNRLSIGVQSFNPKHLKALGRIHGPGDVFDAVEIARAAGFTNFNLDLMFGLPEQDMDEAASDLQTAIELQPTHLSYYQLTLEPNTLFGRYPPQLPVDDRLWEMQRQGASMLANANFTQYEVSAFALPDHRCRHNQNYWMFGDYLGIGAGAHSKISLADKTQIVRQHKVKHPNAYLSGAGTQAAISGIEVLSDDALVIDFMLNVLRLNHGFELGLFEERTGLPISRIQTALDNAADQGLIQPDMSKRIQTTEHGRLFLDNLLTLFP